MHGPIPLEKLDKETTGLFVLELPDISFLAKQLMFTQVKWKHKPIV